MGRDFNPAPEDGIKLSPITGDPDGGVDLSAHLADPDPHTGYQKESEKGAANGYASLDGDGKVPSGQLPSIGGGKLVNRWVAKSTTVVASTASIPFDDTIPQIGEGAELMTVSVTPSSASNKLKVTVSGWFSTNGVPATATFALFVGSTANAVAAAPTPILAANSLQYATYVFWIDSFSGTETISLRGGQNSANTLRWLAVTVSLLTYYGSVDPGILIVEEIAP